MQIRCCFSFLYTSNSFVLSPVSQRKMTEKSHVTKCQCKNLYSVLGTKYTMNFSFFMQISNFQALIALPESVECFFHVGLHSNLYSKRFHDSKVSSFFFFLDKKFSKLIPRKPVQFNSKLLMFLPTGEMFFFLPEKSTQYLSYIQLNYAK